MAAAFRLTRRNSERTRVVRVGDACFGDGNFALIGGPCSVESRDQLEAVGRAAELGGAVMLRGGAWKPRTSPYDFQGLGDVAVELLAEQGRRSRLPVVVEAIAERHVATLAGNVAMIQIGARNMHNVPLLQSAARSGLAILLKRGPSATLDELLLAAEYVFLEGNERVVLCERGIRSFDTTTRNVLDLGGALRLKELTDLPVIVDPSHGSGRRSLVGPLTLAAAAAGLDGAIVEVHPRPEEALSDAAQAIDCATFLQTARAVSAIRSSLLGPPRFAIA